MEQNINKRIAKNTMMLYIRLLASMVIGFYTSRVILNVLGEVDYGIYSLVGGIVILFSFLNSALATSTQRFLTVELGKGEIDKFRHVFRVSVTTHIFIAICIFALVEIIGVYILNYKLRIPIERLNAATVVLHVSTLTFMMQVIQIPFNAVVIANEKMDYYAWLSIAEVSMKLIVALSLILFFEDKLIAYSILLLCTSIIILSIYVFYCDKRFNCRYVFTKDFALSKKLLTFSSWRLLGGGSRIVEQQGFNFALNIYVGIVANASIGIANQVSSLVNGFVTNFQVAFNPQITKYYATGQYNDMFELSYKASKYSFFLLFLLCTPLIFNVDYYLELWLVAPPAYTGNFCIVILCNMMLEAISAPLWMMIISYGRIGLYQTLLSLLIIIGVVISILLLYLGVNPIIALSIRIIISIGILVMRLCLLSSYLRYSIMCFVKSVLAPCFCVCSVSIFVSLVIKYIVLFNPFVNSLIVLSIVTISILTMGMTKGERIITYNAIIKFLKK